MIFDRGLDSRKFVKVDTKQLTIADNDDLSSVVDFERECSFFKIANVTETGIPSSVVIEFMAGQDQRPVFVNTDPLLVEYPDEPFVWIVLPVAAVRFVSLRFSAPVTEPQIWQITGYEEASAS